MSIQDKLISWGRSQAMNRAPNGYPSQTAFARLMSRGNIGMPPLPPDEHMRIDSEVSALKHKKPAHYKVIVYCYVLGLRDSRIAKRTKASRSAVRETRIAAEHYLEGRIE